MQESDVTQFRNVIVGMGRMFGQEIDALMLEMYWLALKGWELEEFKSSAAHLLGSSKFMPRPADFTDLRKAGRMTAGEAFSRAMEIARDCSRHTRSTSGDARIDAAASACGGYFAMGQQETEKIGFLERRFTEHFESISDAEDVREAVPQLAGPSRVLHIDCPQSVTKLLAGVRK